jgi:alkylation response protein AidB-like acyl-CoA dehydrogenase
MNSQTFTQAAPPVAVWPDREGILAGLCAGRFRWDVVHPFPKQDTVDRTTGDAVLDELRQFLMTRVDPDQIDVSGKLPDGLVDELRSRGYLALRMDAKLGGLGLSVANAFRVIEVAMSWSVPVGWCLAIQNGLGAGAYLPLLPAGPLRDLIARRVSEGAIFSDADTDPSGASNDLRSTTATLTADGSAYVIHGEKICIGNGPAADFLVVSATVNDADGERVEYFFLDTSSPGFSVRSEQEFMGLKGAKIGALTFDHVRVPREQMLNLPEDVDTEFEVNRPARMYIVSAPALAIAKLCAHWSREFVSRRSIDGLPLGEYDEIQRIVAATLADAFAIESIVAGGPGRFPPGAERGQEHHLGSLLARRRPHHVATGRRGPGDGAQQSLQGSAAAARRAGHA